jgi:hypothetical protein
MAPYAPTDVVTSVGEIRAVIPDEFPSLTGKIIDHIDPIVRAGILKGNEENRLCDE